MRSPILTQKRARALRRHLTLPERKLWAMLRREQLGLHFRRQQALGPYILDFYCAAEKLCVEVDGPGHAERAEQDAGRDGWLAGRGIRTLRFSTEELEQRPAVVVAAIRHAAAPSTACRRSPSPASRGGNADCAVGTPLPFAGEGTTRSVVEGRRQARVKRYTPRLIPAAPGGPTLLCSSRQRSRACPSRSFPAGAWCSGLPASTTASATIVAMCDIEAADRKRPVTPERMAAAVALCEEARRLLSRHPDAAAVPRLSVEPPMVASQLFVELAKTQRMVLTIGFSFEDLTPEPWEAL